MTQLGYHALSVSLVLSAYASVIYFVAKRGALLKSAHRSIHASFALVTIASLSLFYALFSRDFQLEYVALYSNRSLSWFYTAAAFWAGQAGSLLLWAWLLTFFSVVVLIRSRKRTPELLPNTMGVMSVTTFFFIYLLVFKSNPFVYAPVTPADGNGLNPLLQNLEMIFHPPSLYVGFVGFTVPFAFAISALITRRLDVKWIKSIRRWTLFSWLFLTIGNILGMQWAYVELGWGGYWGWDPVENSSLLPWLTGTAFLHSIIVQERKGMLKTWNLSLIVITFALTIFGTFVTRSGLISSVHAFGVSDLGPLFLGFLALIFIGSIVLISLRISSLKSDKNIGTWTSKESSFLLNNLFFIALTIGVFIGTILPSITEAIKDEKITVGADFFNRLATSIGMAIFLLVGICTLLAWGKTSMRQMLKSIIIPSVITAIFISVILLLGVTGITPVIALGIAVFAISVTSTEYIRGIRARKKENRVSAIKALIELVVKNKRRYGGYIVHLGVLFLFVGITGSSAFSSEKTATIQKGESIEIGSYRLEYGGLYRNHKGDMHIDAAQFNIFIKGKAAGKIKSEKHIHPNFQPATEVGIRSTLKEDLYVILASYDTATEAATIEVLINPLLLWMWIGGVLMVFGTLIALSPKATRGK